MSKQEPDSSILASVVKHARTLALVVSSCTRLFPPLSPMRYAALLGFVSSSSDVRTERALSFGPSSWFSGTIRTPWKDGGNPTLIGAMEAGK